MESGAGSREGAPPRGRDGDHWACASLAALARSLAQPGHETRPGSRRTPEQAAPGEVPLHERPRAGRRPDGSAGTQVLPPRDQGELMPPSPAKLRV